MIKSVPELIKKVAGFYLLPPNMLFTLLLVFNYKGVTAF